MPPLQPPHAAPTQSYHFHISSLLQLGKLLSVEVAAGKVERIEKKDHTRVSAPSGFDSVIVSINVFLL
jgi:hypothetical protein